VTQRIALDEALIAFGPNDVTVRICQAIFNVLPGATPPGTWRSIEAAASALHPDAPVGLADRAKQLAVEPAALNALLVANALDQGDKGITVYTGISTAVSFFFGKKVLTPDAQQRSDAAVKALGLGVLLNRVLPGPPEDAVWTLRHLPTGAALLRYYGAVEIAMPFVEETIAADGRFVDQLLKEEAGSVGARLVPVAGKDGVESGAAALPALTPVLEEMARDGLANVGTLAETVKGYLPAALGAARESLPDIVAGGADSFPIYQFLVSRLVAEALLARARMELQPGWSPAPPKPAPAPPPAPAPAEMQAADAAPAQDVVPAADENPFATPLSALATSATETIRDVEEPEDPEPEPLPAPKPAGRIVRKAPVANAAPVDEAPPAPPRAPPRATPTLILSPEDVEAEKAADEGPGEPLSGSFLHRAGAAEIWLIFSKDGTFTNHPPLKPPPVDWKAHARTGHAVGRYHRAGDQLTIRWPSGREDHATVEQAEGGLLLDGRLCKRADWDLTGTSLRGTWRPRSGEPGGYWFAPDGRFADATDDTHGGTYALGPGRIELRWEQGGVEKLAFLSDLDPDPETPDRIWLGAVAFDRAP
jgi:hypothetical protein